MTTPPLGPLPYATPLPPRRRPTRWLVVGLIAALALCLIALAALGWMLASGTRINVNTTVVRPVAQPTAAPLVMPSQSTDITVIQRHAEPIPGTNGSLVVHLDDITGGQVLVTIAQDNGKTLLPTTSLSSGRSATFRVGKRDYHITAKELNNFLVGEDFAVFRIAPGPVPSPTTGPSTLPAIWPTTRPATQPTAIPGVANFAQVSPSLFRGAQPTAAGFAELKKRGVRTIVNLRSFHSDREQLQGLGLRYVHVYCKTWHPEDADTIRILKVIADPANQPVFIHCQQGADRTGSAVAVYRVIHDGWAMDQAREEMESFGFHPIWTEITEYLARFDSEQMRQKLANTPPVPVEVVP